MLENRLAASKCTKSPTAARLPARAISDCDAPAVNSGASEAVAPAHEGLDCSLQYGWLRGIEDYDLIRARLKRG